jgi:hypothetical protein
MTMKRSEVHLLSPPIHITADFHFSARYAIKTPNLHLPSSNLEAMTPNLDLPTANLGLMSHDLDILATNLDLIPTNLEPMSHFLQ